MMQRIGIARWKRFFGAEPPSPLTSVSTVPHMRVLYYSDMVTAPLSRYGTMLGTTENGTDGLGSYQQAPALLLPALDGLNLNALVIRGAVVPANMSAPSQLQVGTAKLLALT